MSKINLLALHIYHLDNNEECEKIINLLKRDNIDKRWKVELPTEETNAIFVYIKSKKNDKEKFKDVLNLLRSLNERTIDSIKKHSLSVALRIHHDNFYLSLPDFLIKECGRLGIEINLLYEK